MRLSSLPEKIIRTLKQLTSERDMYVCDKAKYKGQLSDQQDYMDISDYKQKSSRLKRLIKSLGLAIEQIEEKLSRIIYQRFFVAGIPDEILGHKLVLLMEGIGELDVIMNEIKSLSTLTKYELPKEVYVVPKFIETETKKIQRKKTLDLLKLY